jgi:hypothetical protein
MTSRRSLDALSDMAPLPSSERASRWRHVQRAGGKRGDTHFGRNGTSADATNGHDFPPSSGARCPARAERLGGQRRHDNRSAGRRRSSRYVRLESPVRSGHSNAGLSHRTGKRPPSVQHQRARNARFDDYYRDSNPLTPSMRSIPETPLSGLCSGPVDELRRRESVRVWPGLGR